MTRGSYWDVSRSNGRPASEPQGCCCRLSCGTPRHEVIEVDIVMLRRRYAGTGSIPIGGKSERRRCCWCS
ncbi:hypothetical protein NEUTE1DRAFT_55081 [Neurospora tetrasperma FGSC 2508]|uniref:Uncharacterized protein n=1 Tax=Neurospora tetrasperma (strain FGSC 2508 / ATCC MYA-4615 / P0657) TaxID=510951 RepID=F8N0J7_NEUT8|nr:uncharacterized protein NEUTE1DRAFT_55081 [Neurospora tetrasperma FGSC 2508]EGO53825.1 hypothetical protein NEUTE1DRAFT_55081 [Neurospora tetrasperma FGSC 2508]EGZ76089.1 hypothetical protein NEUTE2DRAFT_52568 [Neurospora tetrasperma FGSC 2509]